MRIRWSGKLTAPSSRQTGTGGYLWAAATSAVDTSGNVRVTQLPRESVEVGPTLVRVTQAPTEAVEFATPVVQLRVTQLPAEAVEFATPVVRLRVTQLPIEVVYPFRCGDVPPPGPQPPHTEKIRRLRRAPVLTQQALWQFFEWLELDLQTGVFPDGVTEAIIQLRYSDDGGHTWSLPVPIDLGPAADYAKRALWRRLGRGRDRVFEISMVDPILWAICAARLGVREGTT